MVCFFYLYQLPVENVLRAIRRATPSIACLCTIRKTDVRKHLSNNKEKYNNNWTFVSNNALQRQNEGTKERNNSIPLETWYCTSGMERGVQTETQVNWTGLRKNRSPG